MIKTLGIVFLVLSMTISVCGGRNRRDETTQKPDSQKDDKPGGQTNGEVPVQADNKNNSANATENRLGMMDSIMKNKEMLMRTFYVLLGVSAIVVIYFVARAWRTRRKHGKTRKYGLITNSGADLEMEPLDQDMDDDDEMTMFERRK